MNTNSIWAGETGIPSGHVYWLWSQCEKNGHGSGDNDHLALHKSTVERIPFQLPLLGKMNEVVCLIDSALDREVEQSVEHARKQDTTQRQNILRAAFSGQLVPQDPYNEPASALLERIRAEPESPGSVKRPRGRKAKEPA